MDIVRNGVAATAGASVTDQRVSQIYRPAADARRWALYTICLSSVTRTNGITFKLKDSHDGLNWQNVGDQSEAAVAAAKTCASASDINATTNLFTSTAHGFSTGQALVYMAGSVAVPGLTTATVYFCVKIDNDTFKLATTQENALATTPTVIDITGTGTGTQSFFVAHHEIRMIMEDATDQAQLPLKEYVAVFVSTGASDAVTVSNIFTPGG